MNPRTVSILERILFGPNTHHGLTQRNVGQRASSASRRIGRIQSASTAYELDRELSPQKIEQCITATRYSLDEGDDSTVVAEDDAIHCKETKRDQISLLRKLALWRAGAWTPRFLRLRPLVGLAAVSVSIVCTFAALAVLVISNGEPVVEWPIKPSVYLAIFAAIGNSALALARMEAVSVRISQNLCAH